jgi:polysaccharide deacetylase family protein (PEP-CTERM system associated)
MVGSIPPDAIALSFDVEEWFQTETASRYYPRKEWEGLDGCLERTVPRILELLRNSGSRATFFFLGWVVDQAPHLPRAVMEEGHELASHGYSHRLLTDMTAEELGEELRLTGAAFQSAGLPRPRGFRAPSFTMVSETLWAVDQLSKQGYLYDSSVYPMFRHRYGMPGAPLAPFRLPGPKSEITELPMAIATVGPTRFPVAGGAYLRFTPPWLYLALLRKVRRQGRVPVLYLHPWELDPLHGLGRAGLSSRIRQGFRTGPATERTLSRILDIFKSVSLLDLAEAQDEPPLWQPVGG